MFGPSLKSETWTVKSRSRRERVILLSAMRPVRAHCHKVNKLLEINPNLRTIPRRKATIIRRKRSAEQQQMDPPPLRLVGFSTLPGQSELAGAPFLVRQCGR